jgi:hypothetical protein
MPNDIAPLISPIDTMCFIHKGLRAEAARVEQAVNHLEIGGSFKPFQQVLYRWAVALGYHVDAEDTYMYAPHTRYAAHPEKHREGQAVDGNAGSTPDLLA